jgi:hypothetical protein
VLGYTELKPADMHRITQLFRRLYKTPEQVPQISQLLDYFIVLALSNNVHYKDFDEKSVEFVDAGISLIEKRFTGSEYLEVTLKDPITGEDLRNHETGELEKVKLSYFKSIPSQSKIYNKVLVPQNQYTSKLNFLKTEKDLEAIANLEQLVSSTSDEEPEIEVAPEDLVEEESAKVTAIKSDQSFKKKKKAVSKEVAFSDDEELPKIEGEAFDLFASSPDETTVAEHNAPDFVMREDIDSEMHEAVQLQHQQTEMGMKIPGMPN